MPSSKFPKLIVLFLVACVAPVAMADKICPVTTCYYHTHHLPESYVRCTVDNSLLVEAGFPIAHILSKDQKISYSIVDESKAEVIRSSLAPITNRHTETCDISVDSEDRDGNDVVIQEGNTTDSVPPSIVDRDTTIKGRIDGRNTFSSMSVRSGLCYKLFYVHLLLLPIPDRDGGYREGDSWEPNFGQTPDRLGNAYVFKNFKATIAKVSGDSVTVHLKGNVDFDAAYPRLSVNCLGSISGEWDVVVDPKNGLAQSLKGESKGKLHFIIARGDQDANIEDKWSAEIKN